MTTSQFLRCRAFKVQSVISMHQANESVAKISLLMYCQMQMSLQKFCIGINFAPQQVFKIDTLLSSQFHLLKTNNNIQSNEF